VPFVFTHRIECFTDLLDGMAARGRDGVPALEAEERTQ
jgi:hypothetical protein